jgi:hypothetical protein
VVDSINDGCCGWKAAGQTSGLLPYPPTNIMEEKSKLVGGKLEMYRILIVNITVLNSAICISVTVRQSLKIFLNPLNVMT